MSVESQSEIGTSQGSGCSLKLQLGLGVLVIMAVSLLTVLFSILGTITSGALVGMMFGGMKHSRWQAALVSLVFPLVSIAFARLFENTLLMAGICFGTFWLCYLMTCAVMLLEQSQGSGSAGASPASDTAAIEAPLDPNLLELQGRWARLPGVGDGSTCANTIEVMRDQVCLTHLGPDGNPLAVCNGRVHVTRFASHKLATITAPTGMGGARPPAFESGPWLYKIAGGNLTIAWNLDESAPGERPMMESYRRD